MLRDFLPLLAFFVCYKFYDLYAATQAAIVVSALDVGWSWVRHRRVAVAQLLSFGLILGLGGATLFFRNPWFIKFKPTVIYWVLGLAFWLSPLWGEGKSLLHRVMGGSLTLPPLAWQRLNQSWIGFFAILGALNAWVALCYDTDTWVTFKLFGALSLSAAFILAQAVVLSRYKSTHS